MSYLIDVFRYIQCWVSCQWIVSDMLFVLQHHFVTSAHIDRCQRNRPCQRIQTNSDIQGYIIKQLAPLLDCRNILRLIKVFFLFLKKNFPLFPTFVRLLRQKFIRCYTPTLCWLVYLPWHQTEAASTFSSKRQRQSGMNVIVNKCANFYLRH